MSYTLSSSFAYTPDVVDLEAMNITETFPEASSFSFELSGSYNHSYSDSISGIPLAQQALWDDGQLSVPQTVNSSRIYPQSSALSSLNNSANNSINLGHPLPSSSRHLLVPPPQHHSHLRTLSQHHQQHQASPLRGEFGYSDQGSTDDYEDSSLQNSWIDDTRDQNGIMQLLSDKEHQDEQHLLFLQDIGAAGSLSRGDSISLFAKLADESDLSCDLFKEELDADETRDQSRLQFEHYTGSYPSDKFDNNMAPPQLRINTFGGGGVTIGNAIFDQEFLSSLKTPLVQLPPPPLESATRRNFLEGLHTIPAAPASMKDEDFNAGGAGGTDHKVGNEAYQHALKSFVDSLKIADPIKTPHKFAPQPLPILWNEPKIRSKNLPSFNLADYKEQAKATLPSRTPIKTMMTMGTRTTTTSGVGVGGMSRSTKRDSLSSSPTNTHSIPNSTHSSPLSSIATSPPMDVKSRLLSTPKTPTGNTFQGNGDQQQTPVNERSRRQSTIQNPHLAFDPTIPPSERVDEGRSGKNTLDRRSTLQQMTRSKAQLDEEEEEGEDGMGAGTVRRSMPPSSGTAGASTTTSTLRGPVVRKRRSLHQDMFLQEQPAQNGEDNEDKKQYHQDMLDEEQDNNNYHQQNQPPRPAQLPQLDTSLARRGSTRPLSANILPESLTSVNNHAVHQESANMERARRLSEEEGVAAPAGGVSKIPGTLSLGRAMGTRYGRSGSSGSIAQQMNSPTTPTASNPYGTLTGRTPRQGQQQGGGGHRPSLTGLSSVYTNSNANTNMSANSQDSDETASQMGVAHVQTSASSKSQSPTGTLAPSTTTISRSGTRSSPPSALPGLRRPGFASQENGEVQKIATLPSPTDYYDDFYRSEKEDQQTPPTRASYLRQPAPTPVSLDQDVPEWQDEGEGDFQQQQQQQRRRYQPALLQTKTRETMVPAPIPARRSSSDLQKEQHNLQRLRIQQQAREEVYGRGYGNGYADDPEYLEEHQTQNRYTHNGQGANVSGSGNVSTRQQPQQQQHQPRYAAETSPTSRDYFSTTTKSGSGLLRSSPPVPTPTMTMGMTSGQSQSRYSENYRRQSKDGHSLMPAPRISPPLTAMSMSTTRAGNGSGSHFGSVGGAGGNAPRRSLSNVTGSLIPSLGSGGGGSNAVGASRRLSNTANVGSSGYGSGLSTTTSYLNSHGGTNGASLHGRSASSGSAVSGGQRMSMYAPTSSSGTTTAGGSGIGGGNVGLGSARGGSVNLDSNLLGVTPRRSLSTLVQPTKRSSGAYGSLSSASSGSLRGVGGNNNMNGMSMGMSGSSNPLSSSSEYARVLVPPRSSVGAAGGSTYGSNNISSSGSNNNIGSRHTQHLSDDAYSYRPDVPTRQSSLATASNRNSNIGMMRNGHVNGGGVMSQSSSLASPMSTGSGGMSSIASPSHLRRAASMNVNGTSGGLGGGIGSGSATVGRSSGLMANRQQYQQHSQHQGQYQYQQPQPQQQYQRTSMYAYH